MELRWVIKVYSKMETKQEVLNVDLYKNAAVLHRNCAPSAHHDLNLQEFFYRHTLCKSKGSGIDPFSIYGYNYD